MIELLIAALIQIGTLTSDASATQDSSTYSSAPTATTTTTNNDGGTGSWDDGN